MTIPIVIKNVAIGEGIPKICVPLTGNTAECILQEARAAVEAGADIVEWRADFFEKLTDEKALVQVLERLGEILSRIPLIFTIRTREEGGQIRIGMETYGQCCLTAARTGKADLIDVQVFGQEKEKRELVGKIHDAGAYVIASFHNFDQTPEEKELRNRFLAMDQTGADILKIAVMPQKEEDVASIMQVTDSVRKKDTRKPLISMSMGKLGGISRLQGEKIGSAITFGVVGASSAPGQFPIGILRRELLAFHDAIRD